MRERRASIDRREDNDPEPEVVVSALSGAILIVAGLLAWLYDERLRTLKAWDRPRWTLDRATRLAFSTLRRMVLVAGWLLLLWSSVTAALVVAAVLLGAWARIRWVRTDAYAVRRLRVDLETLRRRHPDQDETALLTRLVRSRHPDWGPELAEQMVTDYPDLADLARMLNRMQKGWSALD